MQADVCLSAERFIYSLCHRPSGCPACCGTDTLSHWDCPNIDCWLLHRWEKLLLRLGWRLEEKMPCPASLTRTSMLLALIALCTILSLGDPPLQVRQSFLARESTPRLPDLCPLTTPAIPRVLSLFTASYAENLQIWSSKRSHSCSAALLTLFLQCDSTSRVTCILRLCSACLTQHGIRAWDLVQPQWSLSWGGSIHILLKFFK